MFTLSVKDEVATGLTGIVRALTRGLANAGDVNAAVSRSAVQLTKDHLYDLANTRHRAGVAQNFYEDAADAVKSRDLGKSVEIRIDKAGAAQRFYGGTIEAVNYSHLWIPVHAKSEGKSAGEFEDLIPIISPITNKGVALDAAGEVLFALVTEVTQEADPTVLPTEEQYAEVSTEAVDMLINRMLARHVETKSFLAKYDLGRDSKGRYKRTRIK